MSVMPDALRYQGCKSDMPAKGGETRQSGRFSDKADYSEETMTSTTNMPESDETVLNGHKGQSTTRWCQECKAEGIRQNAKRRTYQGKTRSVCDRHFQMWQNGHLEGKRVERDKWEQDAHSAALQAIATFDPNAIKIAYRVAQARTANVDGADIESIVDEMLEVYERWIVDVCRKRYPQPAVTTLSDSSLPSPDGKDDWNLRVIRKWAFRSVRLTSRDQADKSDIIDELPARDVVPNSIVSATTPGADKKVINRFRDDQDMTAEYVFPGGWRRDRSISDILDYRPERYELLRQDALDELDERDRALLGYIANHSAYLDKGHFDLDLPEWASHGQKRTEAKIAASRYLRACEIIDADRAEKAEATFHAFGGDRDGADIHRDPVVTITLPTISDKVGAATRHVDGIHGKSDIPDNREERPQGLKGYGSGEPADSGKPCQVHGYVNCDDSRPSVLKRRSRASCANPDK